MREYVHVINGSEVRIARGKPSLAPDAVPTLLPGCPAYLSVAAPKQRPERKRRTAQPVQGGSKKQHKPDAPDEVYDSGEMDSIHVRNLTVATSARLSIEAIRMVEVPEKYWCRIETDGHCGMIFATTSISKHTKLEISHEKAVCFTFTEGEIVAEVFYQGVLCDEKPVRSLSEATSVLDEAESSLVCKGAMYKQEFKPLSSQLTAKLRAEANTAGRSVFSVRCFGKSFF
ncbi:hypothetical protein HPB49_021156 [Dermacentor silvarum]|uniref:Uncharacterized protein n=1 Tax=Dermacentor silvarum TaxID=543639 RepID=A0ACB8C5K6_DERSI|nr:hypothetical protein HPB49_021156 [Dermacentor silvarum]